MTGLTWDSEFEILGKYFEILAQAVPNLARLAGLIDPDNPGIAPYRKAGDDAARALGLQLHHFEWRGADHLPGPFRAIVKDRAQAMMVYGSGRVLSHLKQIVDLAGTHKVPAMYIFREAVAVGGLMSFGPDPALYEFHINLKTAKALGLINQVIE